MRIRTPFLYPDGGVVDVFAIPRGERWFLTDHGEALGWLRMQSARGRLSENQQRLLEDVCRTLGMELQSARLVLRVAERERLPEAVIRLGQGVVRVADHWFTLRTRAIESVPDEVARWLEEHRITFDRNARHTGRSGRTWTIDFQTFTEVRTALIFVLATGSRSVAPRLSEHGVAGWHDLRHLNLVQPHLAFVSLFDDNEDVWREEDFRLVEALSDVARWSRPDEFARLLEAA